MTTPEGEGTQSGAEGAQSGTGEPAGGTGSSTDSNTGNGSQSGTDQGNSDAERLQRDLESYRERMKAADQRAAKFEQELKDLRDKDLPEQDKLKRDYEAAQTQVSELQETNKQLALQVAFLKDNTYSWHNPERALRLVDLSQVEIQADGSVSGLKDALKALATSDAYLVKQEAEQREPAPAGTATGNNGGSSGSKPTIKGAETRFPAMRTRVKRG
jgi:chromosome segregation ATPase